MSKKKGKKEKNPGHIPISWNIPEGVITPYASNMFIQTIEKEFKISFFETKPPLLFDDTDATPASVRADYVAGVIVAHYKLQTFINALQKHLDKHNEKRNKKD